jgi:superfamily II DNA or RNA helicase
MKLILETPTKLRILPDSDAQLDDIRRMLKYKDRQIETQIRNMKQNFYMRQRYGDEWVDAKLAELNKELWKILVFEDDIGLWTFPGLKKRLQLNFQGDYESLVKYPSYKLTPWHQIPEHDMYYYQANSVDALLDNPHSHVELPTGSGKSLLIINLLKRTGLRTLVIAPSSSIVEQLYEDAVKYFGKKNVGMFAGAKKNYDKRIIIATAQSLVRIDDKSEAFQAFSNFDAFIFDESHTCPANTFEVVCHYLLKNVPYRWFTSATQERNDGKDLLLEGIIGPRVYEKTISELQEEGYLAKISTLILDVDSPKPGYTSKMAVKMNQVHLYENETIARTIGSMVRQAVDAGMPTLVLIDEHDQEKLLKKFMTVEYEYARSGSEINDIKDRFNEGKLMCIVGTSAISTGTNFLPVRLTVAWQANRAGTKVKQGAIGRSTRIHKETGKDSAKIVDFRIHDVPMLKRHANDRIQYYKQVGPVTFGKI